MSKGKDGTVIGRPKGGKNRKFTPEQKRDFVLECIKENSPIDTFARNNNLSRTALHSWFKKYQERGFEGLESNPIKCKLSFLYYLFLREKLFSSVFKNIYFILFFLASFINSLTFFPLALQPM